MKYLVSRENVVVEARDEVGAAYQFAVERRIGNPAFIEVHSARGASTQILWPGLRQLQEAQKRVVE